MANPKGPEGFSLHFSIGSIDQDVLGVDVARGIKRNLNGKIPDDEQTKNFLESAVYILGRDAKVHGFIPLLIENAWKRETIGEIIFQNDAHVEQNQSEPSETPFYQSQAIESL